MSPNNEPSGNKIKKNYRALKKIGFFLAAIIVIVVVFNAVMFIIGMRTNYLNRWSEGQYFGEITEIHGENIVIQGRNNEKKTVLVTGKTVIKKGRETVKDNLKMGDRIIVFGQLDSEGNIDSELIRIFDKEDMKKMREFLPTPSLR